MESINEIKLDLIKIITNMSDPLRLERIYQTIEHTERDSDKQVNLEDAFFQGQIKIRSGVSKSEIFEEQEKPALTFEEVQEIAGYEPCEESLEELLATLD